jgi:phosphoglucosamine mutase
MAKQLFGTDGIRGVAGEFPLDPRTVHAFGIALGDVALEHEPHPAVLIGADTRESSPWIAAQVAGGLRRRGVEVRYAGVITTPGVAFLTRSGSFVAGVMISASHNLYRDNGLKVFGHSGYKLPDHEEHEIEEEIFRFLEQDISPDPVPLEVDASLDNLYLDDLLATLSRPLDGLSVVLDCGNGAAWRLGPELFRRAGAQVTAINNSPDGRNINLGCGALYVDGLQCAVLAHNADLGIAFDGDADRAIFVSGSGKIVDGDAVLLISALELHQAGRLATSTVVATVMSNLGLEKALEAEGIRLLRTPVGDKYVLEEMLRTGARLGGEQSGHIIFSDYSTTGDGLLTALRVCETAKRSGSSLDTLAAALKVYPQRLVNVRVKTRKPLDQLPSITEQIRQCEQQLAGRGRVLVRFSGTEPLARVMVEAEDMRLVDACTARIAAAIQLELG